MSLKVTVNKKETGYFTVAAIGSIDSETYMILEKEINGILNPSTQVLVLDMKDATYISSMGIGLILRTKQAIEQNRGKFIMTNLKPQVQKVFDILKALPGEVIFKSIEEADAYLADIQKREIQKEKSF